MTRSVRSRTTLSTITATFIENSSFLKKFLTRFFSNQQDIDDVVQEAYLRAFQAENNTTIDNPKAFLFQVAKNVALKKLTRKSKQITDYLEDLPDSTILGTSASVDMEVEALEVLGLHCEAVAALSDKCREVYLLRKVHGLAHKEIAERMNLSVSSVEKYLRQGILKTDKFLLNQETRRLPDTVRSSARGHSRKTKS